jgi:hypothetical protein
VHARHDSFRRRSRYHSPGKLIAGLHHVFLDRETLQQNCIVHAYAQRIALGLEHPVRKLKCDHQTSGIPNKRCKRRRMQQA